MLGFVMLCVALLPCAVVAQVEKLPFDLPKAPSQLPRTATIETSKGQIVIEFERDDAPITVRNFQYLAEKGFYSGLTFHRYIPGFVIQGGDPNGNGEGGPGYTIPPEHSSALHHRRGSLGMARRDDKVNPERRSNGSQFYICLADAPHLDGLYTVFAHVVSGIENAEKLRAGDKILSVKISK